jgi:hypothetical protein
MVECSVVIVNWNTRDCLESCLRSVFGNLAGIAAEVIVVDNGSSDGSVEMVRRDFSSVRLIANPQNLGFSKAINQGIRVCQGSSILLLNSDIVLGKQAAPLMLRILRQHAQAAALACQLRNPDNSVQFFCRRFPVLLTALFQNTFLERLFPRNRVLDAYYMRQWQHDDFRVVEQPPACCLLVRKEIFDTVGLFDERMFLFFSDVDLCLRIRQARYSIYFSPHVQAVHYHGVATRRLLAADPGAERIWHKDRFTYYRKHFGFAAVLCIKAVMFLDFSLRLVESLWLRLQGKLPAGTLRRQCALFTVIVS